MGALIGTLLASGPSLIRAAGALMGGDGQAIADHAADAVEAAAGSNAPAETLEQALASLSPDQIAALQSVKLQIEQIDADREKARLQAGVTQYGEYQQTLRADVASSDPFVRRMRPTFGYILALSFLLLMLSISALIVMAPFADAGNITQSVNLITSLSGTLMTLWSVALAVLGVYVKKRTDEKQVDAGHAPSPGLLGSLAARLRPPSSN